MMANKLDGLIPILYAALQVVSRELTGLIPASTPNLEAASLAIGQQVRIPITPKSGNINLVPGPVPTGSGIQFSFLDLMITKSRICEPIIWTGEEYTAVGGQYPQLQMNVFQQAMRGLVKEVEQDLAVEGVMGAVSSGNVYGTAGTTPFNGGLGDLAQVLKILKDQGTPETDLQAVLNTAAAASMRSLVNLTNVDNSGDANLLRRGILSNLYGFAIRESAAYTPIIPGSGAGYLINGAQTAGATELTVDTGSGAINKGAIITIGSDTANRYVVAEDVASGGTVIKIAGGLKANVADNAAVNIGPVYNPNLMFSRDALVLATRTPPVPEGGDGAKDHVTISDPISGLSFDVALYGEFYQNTVTIGINWGCKSVNPDHSVVLLG
jgi:hypothetical protein